VARTGSTTSRVRQRRRAARRPRLSRTGQVGRAEPRGSAPGQGNDRPTLPRGVAELLGHSQMPTTVAIYSHDMPALTRQAADRMAP
jgi:hypothetical protein